MTQLKLPGNRAADLKWMRSVIAERGVKDVKEAHLAAFLDRALGDKEMAVEAIVSITKGRTYQPLRDLIR